MKKLWNKNFLLGLGCGLILSFLIVTIMGPEAEQKKAAKVLPETSKQEALVGKNTYKPLQPSASPETTQVKEVIQEVTIEIPRGATSSKIAKLLAEKGVIPDSERFLQVVSDLKLANKFYPGSYKLKIGEDTMDILSTLTKRKISN